MSRHYGTTSERGYGSPHQKLRARWKPLVDAGQVQCHAVLCLEERDGKSRWIIPGTPWHLGHTEDRSGWTGPEHERCGAADGARRGNAERPRRILAAQGPMRSPLCKDCGKEYHYAAKTCMICGRHYHPGRKVQYTCSRPCGVAYKRLNYGNGKGVPLPPMPACEICGKPCGSRGVRTCSEACYSKFRASQRMELTCERCGRKFMGRTARWCSPNCQALTYYHANRSQVLAKMAAKRAGPPVDADMTEPAMVMARQSRAW